MFRGEALSEAQAQPACRPDAQRLGHPARRAESAAAAEAGRRMSRVTSGAASHCDFSLHGQGRCYASGEAFSLYLPLGLVPHAHAPAHGLAAECATLASEGNEESAVRLDVCARRPRRGGARGHHRAHALRAHRDGELKPLGGTDAQSKYSMLWAPTERASWLAKAAAPRAQPATWPRTATSCK